MKTIQPKDLTKPQHELIAEYCATYGLEPEQIVFYENAPNEPFFDREATAILIHKLTDAVGIGDRLVESVFPENISVEYAITFQDGSVSTSTRTANVKEQIDGKQMSFEQLVSLATARAARSALVNKGINLVRLHEAAKGRGNVARFANPPQNSHQKLLREVHALGQETGYIVKSSYEDENGTVPFLDKGGWYRVIKARYGLDASSDMSEKELDDFASFLRSQLPSKELKAAA